MAVPLPALPPSPAAPASTVPLLRAKKVQPKKPSKVRPDTVERDRFVSTPHAAVDRRVHMSLRLDPGRHLRLRLEASRTGRSMQSLLIQSLDEFLERDGPGTSFPETEQNLHNGNLDVGSRREPSQTQRGDG